jgi:hypothetical protein
MAGSDKDVKQDAAQKPRGHKGRRFLAVVLLILLAAAAGGYYWVFCRVYVVDTYRTAMETIVKDQAVQQALGQPIKRAWWPPPSARLEDRERDIRWEITGPKNPMDHAEAHVFARKTGDKWEIKTLEVVLQPSRKKISLDVKGDNEAPPFINPKVENKKPEAKGPGPDIEMPVPPEMPGPGGK